MTVNPNVEESVAVDELASVLDALSAAVLVGMMSRMVTVTLPAVNVTTTSCASGNWPSTAVRKATSSKELTSAATINCILTTGR